VLQVQKLRDHLGLSTVALILLEYFLLQMALGGGDVIQVSLFHVDHSCDEKKTKALTSHSEYFRRLVSGSSMCFGKKPLNFLFLSCPPAQFRGEGESSQSSKENNNYEKKKVSPIHEKVCLVNLRVQVAIDHLQLKSSKSDHNFLIAGITRARDIAQCLTIMTQEETTMTKSGKMK